MNGCGYTKAVLPRATRPGIFVVGVIAMKRQFIERQFIERQFIE